MNPNANSFQWSPSPRSTSQQSSMQNDMNSQQYQQQHHQQQHQQQYYTNDDGYNEYAQHNTNHQNVEEEEYYHEGDVGVGIGVGIGDGYNIHTTMNDEDGTTATVTAGASSSVVPPSGSYYALTQPYMPHLHLTSPPPISALAIDPLLHSIYVAGHTVTLNKKRRHATYSTPTVASASGGNSMGGSASGGNNSGNSSGGMRNNMKRGIHSNSSSIGGGGGMGSNNSQSSHNSHSTNSTLLGSTDQRVSMLATHSFPDGMLYSAIAGHEEGRKEVLDQVASALYGVGIGASVGTGTGVGIKTGVGTGIGMGMGIGMGATSATSSASAKHKIPKHAFRPPYSRPLDHNQQTAMMMTTAYQNREFNMGITKILPFSSTTSTNSSSKNKKDTTNKEGYVATISPSSVRIHNRGGLLLSENKVEGMITGTFHPGAYHEGYDDASIASTATHITVGGIGIRSSNLTPPGINCPNLYCMDLYSSTLKTVASHTVRSSNSSNNMNGGSSSSECCITDITTSHNTGNIVAGVSDGTLRIFDGSWRGGNYMECAQVKAHGGGIAQVATAGNLICTTGYSSRSSNRSISGSNSLYAFPDEHVLVFDIRCLGRGGIAHPFSGLNGGPRFISFLPPSVTASSVSQDDSSSDQRILVGSGQIDGGLQIITPFEGLMSTGQPDLSNFIKPMLNPEEESITAMHVMGKDMAIGTSLGNILQYRMAGGINRTIRSKGSSTVSSSPQNRNLEVEETDHQKEELILPSYELDPPELSIEPQVLRANNPSNTGISHSIFNSYYLQNEPILSSLVDIEGKPNPYSFGTLTDSVIKQSSKRILSKKLLDLIDTEKNKNHFLVSIPTSKLGLDLGVHSDAQLPNTNKLLDGGPLSRICYDTTDPRKREKRNRKGRKDEHDVQLPMRYAVKNRPINSRFSAFDFASLNKTIYPGWDYAGPNSYSCSVLLLLYFIPEIRNVMLHSQLQNFVSVALGKKVGKIADASLCTELGFLFHQIDCLASHGMVYPKPPGEKEDPCRSILGAFVPSNFLSTFMTMPEASALALLDGNPAATEVERRPEAFYRFLLHHLDKELNTTFGTKRTNRRKTGIKMNLIDSLFGMNAVSMNTFVNEGAGSESVTSTRSNTVDLAYDGFINKGEESTPLPGFGELLRFSLCKDVPLRAWCHTTQSFETVVQRKIITSLPTIMSLSCACAGVNGEDRLPVWRQQEDTHSDWWLPETIEVEIEDDGNVVTRQLRGKEWEEFRGDGLPQNIIDKIKEATANFDDKVRRRAKYQLQAIVTFINNDGVENKDERGHHVLHLRVPKSHKKQVLLNQMEVTKKHLAAMSTESQKHLTLMRDVTPQDLEKRINTIQQNLEKLENDQNADEWVLFNGPNVSPTVIEDALAFHVPFKEPCIITYRQVEDSEEIETIVPPKVEIPPRIMSSPIQPDLNNICDLIAFDAEFVQVQHEDSILTATGSKIVLKEGRNALGRMSLIDCRTGNTIVDDHVLPREPVVDYLTRFSGIKPSDLNPKISPHHLINSRHAYLKMRYLVDRGCIFVGHGLSQDFLTVNIFVPPSQIIDTTSIFHLEHRRLISLRFLVNYLLGRDMQQDVHDSIEDSRAACELYVKALELKEKNVFDKVLREIYECGHSIDWKVGELNKAGYSHGESR